MATKETRPGLLSKMAMFVRNPTKDWSELDRPAPEQDSGYDKQALKAMIERKRQNDFIRKREFDQLRKLRNRDGASMVGVGRPSVFQSSVATDPDARAGTLKKIDEIEAQMSRQWWKGKQDAAAANLGASGAAAKQPTAPGGDGDAAKSAPFDVAAQSGMPSDAAKAPVGEFLATEMGSGMLPMSAHLPLQQSGAAFKPKRGAPEGQGGGSVGFSTSELFAIEVEDIATDPELEEAAIRFANGDDVGAENGLLEALRGQNTTAEVMFSWASALLDLYRATRNQDGFEQAVQEFGACFDTMVPQWSAIGDPLEPAVVASSNPITGVGRIYAQGDTECASGAIWDSPVDLTALSMENLREAMASNPTPWHLDWSRLEHISGDAMPLLGGLFSSLCSEPVALRFSGADRLVQTLRSTMPSGDRSVDPAWWKVRLNALRTMQLLDEFELVALDFCVTYEVSPPAWQEARCEYENAEPESTVTARVETAGVGTGFGSASTVPMGLDGAPPLALELRGDVLGDATDLLAGFESTAHDKEGIVVSCRALVRVDFSAAGSILNWVAMREAEGRHVQFRDVHRLVAAFFNVIGINEHARVATRPI